MLTGSKWDCEKGLEIEMTLRCMAKQADEMVLFPETVKRFERGEEKMVKCKISVSYKLFDIYGKPFTLTHPSAILSVLVSTRCCNSCHKFRCLALIYSLRVLEVRSTKSFYWAKSKVLESLVPYGVLKKNFPGLFQLPYCSA